MSEKTYSNPRIIDTIRDWPMGGGKRGTAFFNIESEKGKQRAVRVTYCNGRSSAPKKLTYAKRARIVDGSDGRTYIATESDYGFFMIWRGDMKFQEEGIHPGNSRFEMVQNLFLPGADSFEG